ncbi:MAG: mycothiol system anti-sigma-R factor [Actinobacteria bacterium]|nr:mycothiol system anti-sigma-R factor [Actinomycetota bacterium]
MTMNEPTEDGNCTETLQELYQFLDGELTDESREHIRRHLDDCSPCLSAFDFQAELRLVIRNRCCDEVPPSLRDRIANAIQHEADAPAWPPTGGPTGPSL